MSTLDSIHSGFTAGEMSNFHLFVFFGEPPLCLKPFKLIGSYNCIALHLHGWNANAASAVGELHVVIVLVTFKEGNAKNVIQTSLLKYLNNLFDEYNREIEALVVGKRLFRYELKLCRLELSVVHSPRVGDD